MHNALIVKLVTEEDQNNEPARGVQAGLHILDLSESWRLYRDGIRRTGTNNDAGVAMSLSPGRELRAELLPCADHKLFLHVHKALQLRDDPGLPRRNKCITMEVPTPNPGFMQFRGSTVERR